MYILHSSFNGTNISTQNGPPRQDPHPPSELCQASYRMMIRTHTLCNEIMQRQEQCVSLLPHTTTESEKEEDTLNPQILKIQMVFLWHGHSTSISPIPYLL